MAEPSTYPGSPSLSSEAREKVLQTFRHTLEMARGGRNEDALLGCDFVLKMDPRFSPARKLLESLRGVSAGTVVDLSDFPDTGGPAPEPAGAPARPQPGTVQPLAPPAQAAPVRPAPAPAPPAAPLPSPAFPPTESAGEGLPSGGGLDDLAFDDFSSSNPFLASPKPVAAKQTLAPPPSSPGAPFQASLPPFSETALSVPPSFDDPFATVRAPAGSGQETGFASGLGGSSSLEDLGFDQPPEFAPQGTPESPEAASFAPEPPATPGPGRAPAPAPREELPPLGSLAPSPTVDPRISQFLRQGDEAFSRGQIQEAIDLWSRVFLIDLSNDEASRRIDAAREKQADGQRRVDALVSEGIQLYDAGDLSAARHRFLDVLAISESDSTARSYLNQIDAALAGSSDGAETPAPAGASAPSFDGMDFGEPSPSRAPSVAAGSSYDLESPPLEEEEPRGDPRAAGPAKKSVRLDARVLLAVAAGALVLIAAGAYFLFRGKPAPPPPVTAGPKKTAPAVAGEDLLVKAKALFAQGKVDEALKILSSVPPTDPRHTDALALIDQFKSSAEPTPAAAAPSAAALDEMRVAGLAALRSSRYIEAVKSLDPVVKARPDDSEAAQALTKARDSVAALGSAIKAYNEADYESALKLLWDLRKSDPKNQDVDEFLFKSYYNEGVQNLQAGSIKKAAQAFQEASQIRPSDAEAQRHLKFARRYSQGATDLLSRIYVKHVTPRP